MTLTADIRPDTREIRFDAAPLTTRDCGYLSVHCDVKADALRVEFFAPYASVQVFAPVTLKYSPATFEFAGGFDWTHADVSDPSRFFKAARGEEIPAAVCPGDVLRLHCVVTALSSIGDDYADCDVVAVSPVGFTYLPPVS